MSIIWFLLIGLLSGWLASILVRGRGYGMLVDIVIGIIGAVVGGFLFSLLGIASRGIIGDIVMSVIGAVVFLGIVKAIHKSA